MVNNINSINYNFKESINKLNKNLNKMEKTLGNTTASQAKDNVKDIIFWGNGDAWKLLGKASSKNEGWMKSSKAMEIEGIGCCIQVTTQQEDNVAEAVTFVPGVRIQEVFDHNDQTKVVSRYIVRL